MKMIIMLFNLIMLLSISSILIILNIYLSKKMFKSREKNSSFECGFDPMSNTRMPFSIQFFLISIMFLIFDIEIAILIPIPFSVSNFNSTMMFTSMIFMLILIISIYLEYLDNMIEWKKKI